MTRLRHAEPLLDMLSEAGFGHRIEHGGRHPRIVIDCGNVTRFYVIPGSPSDRRSNLNARSDLRRMLGIERPRKRARRARKAKAEKPVVLECPPITPGRDWQAPLVVIRRHVEPWPDVEAARDAYRRAPKGQRVKRAHALKATVTAVLQRHKELTR